jgi:hypothetical protein
MERLSENGTQWTVALAPCFPDSLSKISQQGRGGGKTECDKWHGDADTVKTPKAKPNLRYIVPNYITQQTASAVAAALTPDTTARNLHHQTPFDCLRKWT